MGEGLRSSILGLRDTKMSCAEQATVEIRGVGKVLSLSRLEVLPIVARSPKARKITLDPKPRNSHLKPRCIPKGPNDPKK